MSQTFLEDIPEFLEIQRNSFLRILDIGLIQAFEKINPIVPTSQCKYGLLFYPNDYVLILPENTITEAFLQGKTYGCKIYVPAVIYNIENSLSSNRLAGKRFKSLKTLRFTKTTSSRFSEDTLFSIQESISSFSPNLTGEMKKLKANLEKGDLLRILSWECFFTMLLTIQSFSKKKAFPKQNKLRSETFPKNKEDKFINVISKLGRTLGCSTKDSVLSKVSLITKSNLNTAQRTRKNFSQTIKENHIERKKLVLYDTLPTRIRQKSQLSFFQKIPTWLRGRSTTSLIYEALNRLELQEPEEFFTVSEKKSSKEWSLPFLKRSLINPKYIKGPNSQQMNWNDRESMSPFSTNFNSNLNSNLACLSLAKPVSRKEWVCIGVLPLMTPRGHFIINGSHRIIISQMARAPGLYYQTGEKIQATIVPSKGAWLRLSVKASDNGEIKIWVRITPQRKMPYKIFIETYKYLENSKAIINKGGFKFLNLAYKTLNSKIKHLDKHYAIGYISGQINRTLLNPSSYSLGTLGRKRLNERLGINDKKGYLTSKDISLIKDNLLKLLGQKSTDLSADDIDHLENRRVRTCGELLQTEIEIGMTRLKKAIGKQLDEYSNPDSSLFNTFKNHAIENKNVNSIKESDVSTTQKTNATNALSSYFSESLAITPNNTNNQQKLDLVKLRNTVNTVEKTKQSSTLFWLKTLNQPNWELYTLNPDQTLALFKEKKSGLFWKKNQGLLSFKNKLGALFTLQNSRKKNHYKILYQPKKIGITLAQASLNKENFKRVHSFKKAKENSIIENWPFLNISFSQQKSFNKIETKIGTNLLSPSKIIGTKAFAGALREFFGSNPLSQYMDQTNPLAEITHKRRLSSLGPGGVDRASAGIAIRGIHPSHYGRICPIETPEGKNAGLVNSMTMWARINNEGFLETPYFEVKGGSLMSHTNNLIPHWNFIPTKIESQRALKIVSSDLRITQSAFLPSISLPTRDGSERSFGREKRDYVHFCGISPMQNISVATSLIPFLEHDDATRALMGSNMQRQAVPLLKAKEPLVRTGLEGKVVGESGHALQASCSGIISAATRTFIAIDSFDIIKKRMAAYALHNKKQDFSYQAEQNANYYSTHLSVKPMLCNTVNSKTSRGYQNMLVNSHKISTPTSFISHNITNKQSWQKKQKFIGNIKNLPFLKNNIFLKSSRHSLFYSFSSFLAPRPINSLFYTSKSPYTVTLFNLAQQTMFVKQNKGSKQHVIPKTLWRESFKIKRRRTIHDLQQYTRSNQATVCVQRPAVTEGRWVQKGDLIGDCSASKNGVLALGQNIVVAYLPMEGFNFEDAIVVSDRLVHEELYTSIHVQRVEFDMDALVKKHIPRKIKIKKQKSAYKTSNQDWITYNNPHLLESEKQNLNSLGIINVGSWVGPGDVLVSKVFPVERKIAPSRHLLAAVFQEKKTKILDTDDTSVRVPKGIHGRVINVKLVGAGKTYTLPRIQSFSTLSYKKNKHKVTDFSILCQGNNPSYSSISKGQLKTLPNVENSQRVDQGLVKETLLKQSQQPFNVNTPLQTTSSYVTSLLENQQEPLNSFFSLDYQARKIRIAKSLIRASTTAFKQYFVLDFGTSPSVFQLVPTKKVHTFYTNSTPTVQETLQTAKKQTSDANLISYTSGRKAKNEQNFMISKDKMSVDQIAHNSLGDVFSFTENKNQFSSFAQTSNNNFLFVNLKAKEQATIIANQGLSFKLINNYSSTNASPSLVRRFFFQELINNVTPINKISETTFKNLNVKEIEASNLPLIEKNQELAKLSLIQREELLHSNNVIKKNVATNLEKLKRNIWEKKSINTQEYKITGVRIYIAERKKLQVGDKMSGRHGNKGIVSTILPREDMPYLPDGTPVDMVLNPLGIPSRMNVGQVFECLLGLAASVCGESIGHTPFDEMYGPEASRSLVYLFLYVSRLRSRADWIFQPNFPGKTILFDGRTGTPFEQWVTVGRAYMLKLIHMVDEKIHARSIGPRSLVTQQPVKGRARGGGQRLGEMEIWALEGFGAAYTLQEILTIKADDIKGREDVESSIISATPLSVHIPETFRITLFELRCLCLNLELNQNF